MLKRLRKKFIIFVMALVGSMLIATLGSTYINAWQTQHKLVSDSLDHGINANFAVGPEDDPFGQYTIEYWQELIDSYDELDEDEVEDDNDPMAKNGMFEPKMDGGRIGFLSLVMDIDESGTVLDSNNSPISVDSATIAHVVSEVLENGNAEGYDTSNHVAWKSASIGAYTRIAIVDTSSSDSVLHTQAISMVIIVIAALIVLFFISWWLSSWALKPVEEAWAQQRRFVADASHELKTPLAVILANTQILEKHTGVSDDAMRWVESTADEAGHMKALVGDLLQLARADESATDSSTNVMRQEDIDFSEMVESASLEFDALAFERGCMLDTDIEEGIHITGDPEWLERVVRILIDNACKYGENGTDVTVKLTKGASGALLTVHNYGNTIDEEDLPHVFERFYRSDKARSRGDEGGFGLGLAITKSTVDAHGGSISVTSSQEDGTTFTVRL